MKAILVVTFGLMNSTLSFYECWLRDGDIQNLPYAKEFELLALTCGGLPKL